jgi:hypothetical protein
MLVFLNNNARLHLLTSNELGADIAKTAKIYKNMYLKSINVGFGT